MYQRPARFHNSPNRNPQGVIVQLCLVELLSSRTTLDQTRARVEVQTKTPFHSLRDDVTNTLTKIRMYRYEESGVE